MNPNATPDEHLPIGEVARLLGMSVDTVRRWDREGLIHSFRTLGGQRRFTLEEVQRTKERMAQGRSA